MKELDHYNPKLYAKGVETRFHCINGLLELHGHHLKWRGGERIMDIGCGIGDVTKKCFYPLLPPDFKKLICTDLSPKMLETCREEFAGVEKVEFQQLNIAPPIDSDLYASVDRIFSTFVFMYIHDQKQLWQNVFDLLAPGGDCWVTLVTNAAIFETFLQMAESSKWEGRLQHVKDLFAMPFRKDPTPEKTIEKLLESIGFTDIHANTENFNVPFPTGNDFKDTLRMFPSMPNNLTEEEKEELLDDQVKLATKFNVIQEFYDPRKPEFHPRFQKMVIYARKP